MSKQHTPKPTYWDQGPHGARNYSRAVEAAFAQVMQAKVVLRDVLRSEYPMDARVRVTHYRGSFMGTVAGWDAEGARVYVHNERSNRIGKWWAAHVELAEVRS